MTSFFSLSWSSGSFFFEFFFFFSPLYFMREFFTLLFCRNAFFFSSSLITFRFTLVVVFPVIYLQFIVTAFCRKECESCCFHRNQHVVVFVVEFLPRRRRNDNTEEKEDGDFKTLLGEFTSAKIRGRLDAHRRVV